MIFVIFALQQLDNATLAILMEDFLYYISPTLPGLLVESYNKGQISYLFFFSNY